MRSKCHRAAAHSRAHPLAKKRPVGRSTRPNPAAPAPPDTRTSPDQPARSGIGTHVNSGQNRAYTTSFHSAYSRIRPALQSKCFTVPG
jgi:hypothetical protein